MAICKPKLSALDEYDTSLVHEFILKETTGLQHQSHYAHSPFIITFCEHNLTSIDIQAFIQKGLRIVRFKMGQKSKSEKLKMLRMLDDALKLNTERTRADVWPVAVILDIPNACIKSGVLKEEIAGTHIILKEDWIVEITCDDKYWNQCDAKRIYIDDSYTFQAIKVGTEVTIGFKIVMVCVKVIDEMTIECKVLRGDEFSDIEFVCIRGVKHTKPSFLQEDLELLEFANEYKFDIITMNSVRQPHCLKRVRKMFENRPTPPLIFSSICEQEGLDNIDEIIKYSDGIILGREFLAYSIDNKYKMGPIQLNVSSKCKKIGKPFFVSGNILRGTLIDGIICDRDVNDITNAMVQGAGFVIREYNEITNVLTALQLLNDICQGLETIKAGRDIWRMIEEIKMPANAAEACILSCAFLLRQINAVACVVITVTGTSATRLCHIAPGTVILAITRNPIVARQLQIHKGIIPILYEKPYKQTWLDETRARVEYAANYGLHCDVLQYGSHYVTLMKSTATSSFCDSLSIWTVRTERKLHGFRYFNNY